MSERYKHCVKLSHEQRKPSPSTESSAANCRSAACVYNVAATSLARCCLRFSSACSSRVSRVRHANDSSSRAVVLLLISMAAVAANEEVCERGRKACGGSVEPVPSAARSVETLLSVAYPSSVVAGDGVACGPSTAACSENEPVGVPPACAPAPASTPASTRVLIAASAPAPACSTNGEISSDGKTSARAASQTAFSRASAAPQSLSSSGAAELSAFLSSLLSRRSLHSAAAARRRRTTISTKATRSCRLNRTRGRTAAFVILASSDDLQELPLVS
mmetsp:Transcript_16315/g.48998  ORF Transcript_16315/g.48998 Transcript_16315/m.48998 type:complete len:276 (-) Transcript_16315:12-839(-)